MLSLDGCCCFFDTESNILSSMFDIRIHKFNSTCNRFMYLSLKFKTFCVRVFGFRRRGSRVVPGLPSSNGGQDFLRTLYRNFSRADAPEPPAKPAYRQFSDKDFSILFVRLVGLVCFMAAKRHFPRPCISDGVEIDPGIQTGAKHFQQHYFERFVNKPYSHPTPWVESLYTSTGDSAVGYQ